MLVGTRDFNPHAHAVGVTLVLLACTPSVTASNEVVMQSGLSFSAVLLLAVCLGVVRAIYHVYTGRVGGKSLVVPEEEEDPVKEMSIKFKELRRGALLGAGSTGKVYKAKYRSLPVTVKELYSSQNAKELEKSLIRLLRLRHPDLVLMMGVSYPAPEKLCIVSEYMETGPLYGLLHNQHIHLDWKTRMAFAKSVAQGMVYLHRAADGVPHQNLNSVNVLVNSEMQAKISDYGLAAIRNLSRNNDFVVKPVWTAPEVLKSSKYSQKSDVYSFGIILWEILTRQAPFSEPRHKNTLHLIQSISLGERPAIPLNTPETMKQLITQCWHSEPNQRPTFTDIVGQIEFLENLEFDPSTLVIEVKVDHQDESDDDEEKGKNPEEKLSNQQNKMLELLKKKPWFVDAKGVVTGEALGAGSLGKVYSGTFRGKNVAIKKIQLSTVKTSKFDEFINEMNVMCTLRHPNTILFMGAFLEKDHLCILMEQCEKGSLFSVLNDMSQHVDYNMIIKICTSIAEGMNYLHLSAPPILHHDLKSLNILIDEDWNVKVSDFGLTQFRDDEGSENAMILGTQFWMAPEAMQQKEYTERSDIYSFGMIMWELFTRKTPFPEMNPHQAALAVITEDARPVIPDFVPPRFHSLIEDCWQRDPDRRPSFTAVLEALAVITKEGLPRTHLTSTNARFYRKSHVVSAFQSKDIVTVFKSWGTGQSKPGDWIIVGPNDDVYTCDAAIFMKTYEPVKGQNSPNLYRKVGMILAKEMDRAFLIDTLEGTEHGLQGDFLAQNPVDGEQWPIAGSVFQDMYEEVPPEELRRASTKLTGEHDTSLISGYGPRESDQIEDDLTKPLSNLAEFYE